MAGGEGCVHPKGLRRRDNPSSSRTAFLARYGGGAHAAKRHLPVAGGEGKIHRRTQEGVETQGIKAKCCSIAPALDSVHGRPAHLRPATGIATVLAEDSKLKL